ncbi:MAG TPA: alpha/beta-hydrolase N-terminal domain-containing protein, partial [Propionicimonas sp.]|nr:alpha/beta-hydrolase N-terminal domain-containing protein [Propionicimonas sp.]
MKRYLGSLDPLGVVLAAILLALSLTPSLLPRSAVVQGFGSGVVFGIGYALGVAVSALLARWVAWRPSAAVLRWVKLVGWPVFTVVMVAGMVGGVAAQNEVRRMVE